MDKEQLKRLAKDPRFISGIYNYCDRWCERCALTRRCMNYALGEEEFGNPESRDITNKAFWDKLHGIFQVTLEMARETADKMGIDLDAIDRKEIGRQEESVDNTAQEQPYSQSALAYVDMADKWFDTNKVLFEDKANELVSLAQAEIPGANPEDEALSINDCLEVVRWYQHQIYVKLCRAATGMMRGETEEIEYFPEDANGSSKVAIIGIERSIAAWGHLMQKFPEQENSILDILAHLQRLLKQVEDAFPDARAYVRPGLDEPPT